MRKLGTIKQEVALCRARFAGVRVGAWVHCCHHEVSFERLTEPAENRIVYILGYKNIEEQAIRLSQFAPVKARAELDKASAKWDKANAEWVKARAELDKASHLELCPLGEDCRWDADRQMISFETESDGGGR